jgi:hydrogenase maturation protease
MTRVLVAGVGNIFLADDGFGSEVARRLEGETWPPGVRVHDFGISGVHLAYELLEGYDALVLIDAVSNGDPPGTVCVLEPEFEPEDDEDDDEEDEAAISLLNAHGLDPVSVMALVSSLGGRVGQVLVVTCEVASLDESMGLTEPVAGAVSRAVDVVHDLVAQITAVTEEVFS